LSQEWDELLAPVDEVAPAGADPALSDPLFQAVVQAARGHTDYQFDGKNEVEFYRPPNWSEVKRQVLDCLGRSRDIRLAIILVRALTAEAGPAGLARGLSYVERLLAGFWDTAHPAPDPSESTPAERYFTRINALKLLAQGDGLPREILGAPLIEARGIGRFSLRQVQLAQGKGAPVLGESRPEPGMIQAAIEQDPQIVAKRVDVAHATAALRSIGAQLQAELGVAAPNLAPLGKLLGELAKVLGVDTATASEADPGGALPATSGPEGATAPAKTRLDTRGEVLAALDGVLAFYSDNDPASPIPLFLTRIRRLVPMSFTDLLRELAPSGLAEIERLADVDPPVERAAAAAGLPAAVSPPSIGSREAVVETLDAVIEFYQTREPSSPIPVLVRRIRRLVPMGFVALLQDIAPKGLAEFVQFADSDEQSGQ
jgi:type VI secretion system protein ImpA